MTQAATLLDQTRAALALAFDHPLLRPAGARIGLALGLCVLVLGGAGWIAGAPPAATGQAAAPEVWALPAWARPEPAQDVAALRVRQPWGAAAGVQSNPFGGPAGTGPFGGPAPAPAPPPKPPLKLVGILARGGRDQVVFLAPGATKTEVRGLGETLPDGAAIRAIGRTSVTLEREGATETRTLFRLDAARRPAGAPTPTPDGE